MIKKFSKKLKLWQTDKKRFAAFVFMGFLIPKIIEILNRFYKTCMQIFSWFFTRWIIPVYTFFSNSMILFACAYVKKGKESIIQLICVSPRLLQFFACSFFDSMLCVYLRVSCAHKIEMLRKMNKYIWHSHEHCEYIFHY